MHLHILEPKKGDENSGQKGEKNSKDQEKDILSLLSVLDDFKGGSNSNK